MARQFSVLIRNGLVFDGAGNAPARQDIGIDEGVITEIGDLSGSDAALVVDASNRYVAPGFIDLTNHSDTHWTLFDHPRQESLIGQGITTVVGGACGSSLAPLAKPSDIEGIQKWTDITRININWQRMGEFLSILDGMPLGVNVATLVGHGTLRRAIGMDISSAPTADDIARMTYLLRDALAEGAFGLSTSLGRSAALTADHEELGALFSVVEEYGGVTTHHLADEGAGVVAALSRIVALFRERGARAHISHFKVIGRRAWPNSRSALDVIERAREGGVALTADVFPYTRTGSNLYLLLPDWAREGGKSRILSRLADESARGSVVQELRNLTLHYEKITVASTLHDTDVIGKTIAQLAQTSGRAPEEIVIDLLQTNQLNVAIFNEAISEENMGDALLKNYVAVASDGVGQSFDARRQTDLPHPRSFGAFPRAFSVFVRERNILTWKDALHRMTGLPASIVGIRDRGLLGVGKAADIVVFNPETIRDRADYTSPRERPEGIDWVFVNGQAEVAEGEFTNAVAGRPLRRI